MRKLTQEGYVADLSPILLEVMLQSHYMVNENNDDDNDGSQRMLIISQTLC